MNIGDNIKKIRKERNITQSELATKMGISQSYLSDIENGRKNLGIATVEKIANKLGVSVAYLTSGNKMMGDLTDEEIEEEMFKMSKKISQSKSRREEKIKESLFNLINNDLSFFETHYFNNIYNFYELEKTEDNNLLFVSILLQMLRKHKMSGSKEAYEDIINKFDDFLKQYLNIK
ncbi:helix-turn-helix domain-containing protein [Staphylococcus simulans]|uniref:helix-turn-helix domain-containing protein n=1 Tax=Staphylococcus simulans TaxID=1286 RepID=UPI000D1D7306|nr:helix-turn-helix transcriptional regulator [Staphylococcus simulans]PTJ89985.1 transcriptional regulator [Staphylococcus simulans]RIN47988.1 XRE family transcriptional regulator [Staphylococcus simulans]UXR29930.1 helix-turn-helix domain-containing protein [Staphylococcus simulans]UXR52172.1 helix-turn-helix domain-containing protein [Staphylococcus simulans]UXV37166.1 helix-turn-helix domain-containing protein [Staphylococcus simulans]